MKKLIIVLSVPIIVILLFVYQSRDRGEPVKNFEAFFKAFKDKYALFRVKQIDWNKEYDYYSNMVDENTTDDELFEIFTGILNKLDDKHCYIYRFNEIYFSGFNQPSLNYLDLLSFDFRVETNDFDLDIIQEEYLVEYEKSVRLYSTLPPVGVRDVFTTGWLKDSVAYIHMTEMSNKSEEVDVAINSFINKYNKANGFVIDIRDNIGGYSGPVKRLAEFFADDEHIYAVSRLRSTEDIYSLGEPEYWRIKPDANSRYNNQPVVLLINGNTQSAAELFTLMMKSIPNVKIIGNTTTGVFADTHIGKLPNGWEYRLSERETNNRNDIVMEDIGIVPDTLILNSKDDIQNRTDKVIEYALEYVRE